MSDSSQSVSPESTEPPKASLLVDDRSQTINVVIYVASNWLNYLAAPVLYVGITQAALCNKLGGSAAISNLPNSASFWMTALPMLVIWKFPRLRVRPAL